MVESVAAANPTTNGYLSVYPAGGRDPNNAAVNFNASDSQANDLTAPLVSAVSPTGQETITNHSTGTVDIIVTARGYYSAPTAPAADLQTDAGVLSGTATVIWQAPDTDGGAAINCPTASPCTTPTAASPRLPPTGHRPTAPPLPA